MLQKKRMYSHDGDYIACLCPLPAFSNSKFKPVMNQIPCAPQIRYLLDPVSPEHVTPLLMEMGEAPHRLGGLANHRMLTGGFAVALDGVEYISSSAISCPNGSTRTQANGQTRHFHVALTPVLIAPGQESVFPLSPVFVTPQDGHRKQDCKQRPVGAGCSRGRCV